jgi:hypothetical protein
VKTFSHQKSSKGLLLGSFRGFVVDKEIRRGYE